MSERNTVVRALHDLGAAAWFGGSLMGAVGVNGAAAAAKDPQERTRLSSIGWARWTPWQVAAIVAHTIGGIGVLVGNRRRVAVQSEARSASIAKIVVTAAAMGVTAWAGLQGSTVARRSQEGAQGATEPGSGSSDELASAQRQLKAAQWLLPVLTGALVVIGTIHGEQQRGPAGVLDMARRRRR
ncbi:hypothetical protein DT076_06280 [Desertihabitans brevis]|uniref:DUF2269 family protein n=1 Tax=Desertihabitans brevis TaxID=2268447 RepID=A0A367YWI8_9ACTN|nr:hypothetical protein [Desertihabitans brevis]RCK70265.1 hypothetical protein DT076_06280 [Desertihabitans brevis]